MEAVASAQDLALVVAEIGEKKGKRQQFLKIKSNWNHFKSRKIKRGKFCFVYQFNLCEDIAWNQWH